jgi:hypothetical protein
VKIKEEIKKEENLIEEEEKLKSGTSQKNRLKPGNIYKSIDYQRV